VGAFQAAYQVRVFKFPAGVGRVEWKIIANCVVAGSGLHEKRVRTMARLRRRARLPGLTRFSSALYSGGADWPPSHRTSINFVNDRGTMAFNAALEPGEL